MIQGGVGFLYTRSLGWLRNAAQDVVVIKLIILIQCVEFIFLLYGMGCALDVASELQGAPNDSQLRRLK